MAEREVDAAGDAGPRPALARVLLRELLRYGGLAVLRNRGAPRIYLAAGLPEITTSVVRGRAGAQGFVDIIETGKYLSAFHPLSCYRASLRNGVRWVFHLPDSGQGRLR